MPLSEPLALSLWTCAGSAQGKELDRSVPPLPTVLPTVQPSVASTHQQGARQVRPLWPAGAPPGLFAAPVGARVGSRSAQQPPRAGPRPVPRALERRA